MIQVNLLGPLHHRRNRLERSIDMLPIHPKWNVRDVVAIGASAGGIAAVPELISRLPKVLARREETP